MNKVYAMCILFILLVAIGIIAMYILKKKREKYMTLEQAIETGRPVIVRDIKIPWTMGWQN